MTNLSSVASAGPTTPVADAGDDQLVEKNQLLSSNSTLDATGSSDPDGKPLDFWWFGPFPTTNNGSTPPVNIPEGKYTVSLVVVDNNQLVSDVDTAMVEVTPCFNINARSKSGKVQLTWTHIDGTEKYDIYRSEESDPFTLTMIAETTSTYSTYLDVSIQNENTYIYAVGADNQGSICYSDVISIHPTARRAHRGSPPANYAPLIYSPPVTNGTEGIIYNYDINATDPNGDTLSYNLTTAPAGMTIDLNTGLVEWVPANIQVGAHEVVVMVQDGKGGSESQTFTITVSEWPINNPPKIISQPITSVQLNPNDTDPNLSPIVLTPQDTGSLSPNSFTTLPSEDPSIYGFTGEDVRIVNFDITPTDTPLKSGDILREEYSSIGINMSDIEISSSYMGGGASEPNSAIIDGEQEGVLVFTFKESTVATGFISVSPKEGATNYTDRGEFEQQIINRSIERYGFDNNSSVVPGVSFENLSGTGSRRGNWAWVTSGVYFGSYHRDSCSAGTIGYPVTGGALLNSSSNYIIASFDQPVFAVGAELYDDGWSERSDLSMEVEDIYGNIYLVQEDSNCEQVGFLGFTCEVGITKVTWRNSEEEAFEVDNFTFSYREDLGDDYVELYSPDGRLLYSNIDTNGIPKVYNRDTFIGTHLPEGEPVGSLVISNSNNRLAVDEFIFVVSNSSLPQVEYIYNVVAVDEDNDPLLFSIIEGPENMVIDPVSGVVTWYPDTTQIGMHTVTIQVSDGKGGTDTQTFSIEVSAYDVDLTISSIDNTSLVFDNQELTVAGDVSAKVTNNGPDGIILPFDVLFFDDVDFNGSYDVAIDNVLGSTTVTDPLPSGGSLSVIASLSGNVRFSEVQISGFVDSSSAIDETNEDNNIMNSMTECEYKPPVGEFNPVLEWAWTGSDVIPNSNQVMMTPVAIDLNSDGIPDIIFSTFSGENYTTNGTMRAVSGIDGSELWTITSTEYEVQGRSGISVGDIDLDGHPEIIAHHENALIIAFEHDGSFKWKSNVIAEDLGIGWGGPTIADLDNDGTPEIIVGSTVFNNDGTVKWKGVDSGGTGHALNHYGSQSIVADLDMDGILEVVAGKSAFHGDGSLYWNASIPDGFPAIGNFDDDNYPEIVVVSHGNVYLLEHTGDIKWGPISLPGGHLGGPPTIADMNGDNIPEIGIAGQTQYVVFESNGSILWQSTTFDGSAVTGSSVFDFDGDGNSEVVYGDEDALRIYKGTDGTILYEFSRGNGTTCDLPLIVDIDNDGNAEIIIVANDYWKGNKHGIFVIGDANDTWVNTRKIWNQHAYSITNVNDDGTIPQYPANNWETFNNFRCQQSLDALACVDLATSYVRADTSNLPDSMEIKARVGNSGALHIAAGTNVAFYNGDPDAGGVLLGTTQIDRRLDNHIVGTFKLTIYHNVDINCIVNYFLMRCCNELLCRN